MDKGDVDNDGDLDLMLGSFILQPGRENMSLLEEWIEEEVDVMVLENVALSN